MALIYWGEVDAASDITMAFTVNTIGTLTRQAIIDLITPIAAGIIADDPAIIEAAEAAVNEALSTILALSKCVHFESGIPVYDGPLGPLATHYIFPDHTGEQVIRPTPFPTPLATPAFTW